MNKLGKIIPAGKSFKVAFRGMLHIFLTQTNARFHLLAALIVVLAGFFLRISVNEWLIVLLLIAMVLSAEAFNTAIEMLVDKISPDYDKTAGLIKDVAAGAVLITAVIAAISGLIIFGPKIYLLIF